MRGIALAAVVAMATACAPQPRPAQAAATPSACELTSADLLANRATAWTDFDQTGITPNTWRALGERGCHDVAAQAYTDYLAFGSVPAGERWQTTARFHLGQSLALAGRSEEAARMFATARREIEVGGLHWNLYVQGTYAFMARDRPKLDQAFAELAMHDGSSDRTNARVLAGLRACWERPYSEAYGAECRAASGVAAPSD